MWKRLLCEDGVSTHAMGVTVTEPAWGTGAASPNLKSAGMGQARDEACQGKSVFKTYKVDMRQCKWPRLSGLLWRDREGTI